MVIKQDSFPFAYPQIATSTLTSFIIPFHITKPVYAGDTIVLGTGPSGVRVILYDITLMGKILGEATINNHGNFSISVDPLPEGHRIGINIDFRSDNWSPEDFQNPAYNGDEALQVPLLGFFYDTALIIRKD